MAETAKSGGGKRLVVYIHFFYAVEDMEQLLGMFEQAVLQTVSALGSQAYGTPIRQMAVKILQRPVSVGALYATLTRLEKKGLISSTLGEATVQRGGRAKRYFRLEGDGARALSRARQTAERLWQHGAVTQ